MRSGPLVAGAPRKIARFARRRHRGIHPAGVELQPGEIGEPLGDRVDRSRLARREHRSFVAGARLVVAASRFFEITPRSQHAGALQGRADRPGDLLRFRDHRRRLDEVGLLDAGESQIGELREQDLALPGEAELPDRRLARRGGVDVVAAPVEEGRLRAEDGAFEGDVLRLDGDAERFVRSVERFVEPTTAKIVAVAMDLVG